MSSWGEILVEWCNCLQLSPEIKDINELRESDFFKNILSILNKSELSSNINQPLIQILTLLSETYQNAQIEDINCDSFVELQEDKFLIITSLLLHYTCLYDGREQFTLPLCQNLNKKSQLSIKDFLEKVNKEVTYSDLEKLIVQERVYEYVESKPTRPLTAVFRTPSMKRKFNFEKDRTVNKLKTALELEQYEKADVEEELKLQIKKTQKLERLLSKSNDEISALKSEIFKIKCQTPPQCSKRHDSEHKMRLMRKELENFEQYIENSEKENDILREEHHLYKQKIEEYEAEYAELRSKYLSYEEQIDELTRMLNEKSLTVKHLETHCKELNEILEGFRQQKPESVESSFSEFVQQNKINTSFVNQENLASAVIEIQLKEAQEQIEEYTRFEGNMKQYVNDLKTFHGKEHKEITALISKLKESFELYEKELSKSEEAKEKLHIELKEKDESNSTLLINLEHLKEELNKITSDWAEDKKLKEHLINKLSESEKNLIEENEKYLKEIENIKIEKNDIFNNLEQSEKKNNEISNRIIVLQESLDRLNLEKNNQLTEMEELSKKILELENIISTLNTDKKQKEHLINKLSESEKNLIEENEKYSNEIENIKIEKNEIFNNLEQSVKKINEISNRIIVLQESLDHLNLEKNNHLTEMEEQSKKILEFENIISTLNADRKQKETLINKLSESEKNLIGENEKYIKDIENLRIEKNNISDNLDQTEKRNNEIFKRIIILEESLNSLNLEKKNQLIEMEEQSKKILELENIISTLNADKKQKEHLINKLSESEKNLISENEKYINDIENLRIEKNNISDNLDQTEKRNNEISKRIIILEESLNSLNLEKKNQLIEMEEQSKKILELENIISTLNADKKQKEHLINKLSESEKNLTGENEKYMEEIENIKIEKNDIFNNLEQTEKRNTEISKRIIVLQESLDSLNLEKKNHLTEMEEQNKKILELENIISTLNADKKQKEHLINKLSESEKNLIGENEKYIKDIENIKIEKNDISNNLEQTEKRNNEISKKIIVLQESLDNLNLEKKNQLIKMEEQSKKILELENIISTLNADKKQKEHLINKLSESEKNLIGENEKYIKEIENIKIEKNDIFNNLEQSEKKNNEISNRIIVLQESLDSLNLEKKNQLIEMEEQSKKTLELENIISTLNAETEKRISDFCSKNKKLEEITTKYEQSQQKLEEYFRFKQNMKQHVIELKTFHNKEFEVFNNLVSKLKKSIDHYENELAISEQSKEKLLIDLDKMRAANSILEVDLENLKEEVNRINTSWTEDKKEKEIIMISKNKELKEVTAKHEKSKKELEQYITFYQIMKKQVDEFKNFHKQNSSEYHELILKFKESIICCNKKLEHSEELNKKLKAEIAEKMASNSSLLTDLNELKKEINTITSNLNEEKMQKENLLEKLSILENQLISEKQKYLKDIEEIKNERNNFCNELKLSEKENKEVLNRIVVLQETIDHLNTESNNKLERMEKGDAKISELENEISNLKAELDLSNSSLSSKNNELQETMAKYENSLKKIEKYVGFEQFMKQQVEDLKSFHKKESSECNNLISKLKESLDIYDNKLLTSEEQNKHLATELKEMKTSNSALSNEMNNLKELIDKTNSDWDEDKRKIEKITNENQLLKDNFIGLTQTIKLFNDELNKTVRSLKERKNKSNLMLNKLQSAYKEVNTSDLLKTPEKNSKPNDVSSEINILGQQISKLNVYIDIFSEKETFYLKELESLKEELSVSNNNRFEAIETLKEQILENEHQITSQTESLHSLVEKYNQLQMENQEYLNKIEKNEAGFNNVKQEHTKEILLKEQTIVGLKEKIQSLEEEIINLKKVQSNKTEELLEKLVVSQNQIAKDTEEIEKYKTKIVSLEARIAIFKEDLSQIKNKTSLTEEEYETNLANLQVQVVKNKLEITELKRKCEEITNEKEDLSAKLRVLEDEKDQEIKDRKAVEEELAEATKINFDLKNEKINLMKDLETLKDLQEKCFKYEQDRSNVKFLEEKHVELSQKIDTLMKSSEMQKESYEVFKIYYRKFKDDLDKLLSQKNSLENLTNNLRTQIVSLNKYMSYDNSKRIVEKKEALDVISEDIMKQYNRYSKQINDIVQELVRYYENNCDNIFASLEVKIEDCLEKYNIPELSDLLSDLTDRAVDILEQIRAFQREFENACKEEDAHKENILTASRKINIEKMKEDDLKKKNLTLRQKITLLENTKGNLEKTVKKLREENKKLKENDNGEVQMENDPHYKILLQEYISYKEDQERILKEYKIRLEDLQKEYEEHKDNCMRTSTPLGQIFFPNQEADKNLESELDKLKIAFSNVRITNEKLENENMLLKQIAGAHKEEIGKFSSIKEAYDKLLEENNKLMTEVDTMKYKRTRDRDEFLRCLKKEKYENESKYTKMIQNIKAEYETKLEKMKDKMIKLYREEVNKEMSKIKGKQQESNSLVKTVEQLKCDLFEANQKIQLLMERDAQKRTQDNNMLSQMHGSNSQLHELDTLSLKDFPLSCMNSTAVDSKPKTSIAKFMEFKHPHKVNPSSLDTRRQYEERQVRTLPRSGTIVEEVNIRRRTSFGVPNSIGNLQMEDEEEMFNNKYLTDLKQGNCELPTAEGRDSRVSELAWRNSLVPPHLKSSYPAETQFCSPERFREDDIKCGGGTFDDSSSKLLPNEKRKKDFGTTSYKKPGPPTPSKNGGRLSLTGSDSHVPKEQPSESKKNTPGRIRSLFSGRSSSRNSIEPGASPKKRLSIFRK